MTQLNTDAKPRPFTSEERQLVWQCRRGLKELDVLLEPFMAHHYRELDAQDQTLFKQLLTHEDVDLLSWFMQYLPPEDPDMVHIVNVVLKRLAL